MAQNDPRGNRIRRLRDAGLTWGEVAREIGLSATRCQQLGKDTGRPEKPVTAHPAAPESIPSGTFDLLSARRAICAHRVRGETIPRGLRIHDHLSLGRIARKIRDEMKEAGDGIDQAEAYVERHVTQV